MQSCTVIFAQYNPDKEKLMRSIQSISMQKDIQIQIVIADDGSKNDYIDWTKSYLNSCGITDLFFSKNSVNQGTVLNVFNALQYAKYKYLSFLSPGDYYYDEYTLRDAVGLLAKGECQMLFGRISPYLWDKNGLHLFNRQMPYDHKPYEYYMRTGDDRLIRRNMILYRDAIIGASCYWEKDLFQSYLKEITGKVRYMEDVVCINAVLDKVKICYLDRYVVWYEYGLGVSTSLDKKWREKMNEDDKAFFRILINKYPNLRILKRRRLLSHFDSVKGYKLLLLKCFLFPDRFVYIFFRFVLFREKMPNQETAFIRSLYDNGEVSCRL